MGAPAKDGPDDEGDQQFEDVTTRHGVMPSVVGDGELVPTLVIVSGTNSIGRTFRIDDGQPLVIGRSPSAHIPLADDGISRLHARVERHRDDVTIADLQSRNGTFVNGARIEAPRVLKDGDKIQFGSTTMIKFTYRDSADEALQRNLYESATRDGLTHAHNKKFFTEALAKEFAYVSRHDGKLSLTMFDLDHFKSVNDRFGHLAGDAVLKYFALLVHEQVRSEDLFARWGGEEFVLLLRDCPCEQAVRVAERIRRDFAELSIRGFPEVKATVSGGVSTFVKGRFSNSAELIAGADALLYQAKNAGRNRIVSEPEPQPPRISPAHR
jgi:diguanylate cyclase (GGDEF)-like protein